MKLKERLQKIWNTPLAIQALTGFIQDKIEDVQAQEEAIAMLAYKLCEKSSEPIYEVSDPRMLYYLKHWYDINYWNEVMLSDAVDAGWITHEDFINIVFKEA